MAVVSSDCDAITNYGSIELSRLISTVGLLLSGSSNLSRFGHSPPSEFSCASKEKLTSIMSAPIYAAFNSIPFLGHFGQFEDAAKGKC